MEVQFHFSIDDPPHPLNQAAWLVIRFTLPLDLFQGSSGEHCKCALMDDLVSGIQFGNDEVDGRSVRQHPMLIRIFVRTESREWWQKAMVQIDNSSCESPAGPGGGRRSGRAAGSVRRENWPRNSARPRPRAGGPWSGNGGRA